MRPHNLTTIQAGRALAAIAVVVYHAALYAGDVSFLMRPTSYGYLGVDFFFVLSGFIIYHLYGDKAPICLRRFGEARLIRIFVPYLPVGVGIALLAMLMPWLKPGGDEWAWLPTLTLLPFGGETALGVAWTLRHELVFYALFALALFAGRPMMLAVAWPVAIGVAHLCRFDDRFIFAPINIEFALGMVAAWLVHRDVRSRWLILAGVLTFALSLFVAESTSPGRVLFGVAVALLLVPIVQLERAGRLSAGPLCVLFGNASYAIYLVHNPLITLLARLPLHPFVIFAAAIVSSAGAGLAYHKLWEVPVLRRVRNWPRMTFKRFNPVAQRPE